MESPAGLHADFTTSLFSAGHKMRTLFDAMVKDRGLTLPRARALLYLSRRPSVSQTELAAVLEIESSTMVRLLDGLEEQGLIERNAVAGDRRVKQITLTEAAAAQVAELDAITRTLREAMLRDVSARDLEVAVRVLRQAVANLAASG